MSINHESSLATERVGGAFALPQEHLLAARGEQEAVARVEPLPLGRYLYSPPGERVRTWYSQAEGLFLFFDKATSDC